jgi:hypothetical protein
MASWAVRNFCALHFGLLGALAIEHDPFSLGETESQQSPIPKHVNEWAVIFKNEIVPFREQADQLAEKYGFINLGQVFPRAQFVFATAVF